jgi:hypothetical protein
MKPLVFGLGGSEAMAARLSDAMYAEHGALELHRFPTAKHWFASVCRRRDATWCWSVR